MYRMFQARGVSSQTIALLPCGRPSKRTNLQTVSLDWEAVK